MTASNNLQTASLAKSLKGGLNPYLTGGHSGEITPMGGSKAYVVTSDVRISPLRIVQFWPILFCIDLITSSPHRQI